MEKSGDSLSIPWGQRVLAAVAIGLLFGGINAWIVRPNGPNHGLSDFLTYWLAAKGLLAGAEPYAYVAAHRPPAMFAPLPIGLLALPFAWMPAFLAAPVFFGLGCAALAFALTKHHWHRLLVFAAAPIWHGAVVAQVTPLLVAASVSPVAWGVLTAKPNVALPLLAMRGLASPRRPLVIGALSIAVVLGVTVLLSPQWPLVWLHTVRADPLGGQYRIPMRTAWGFVLWLPLLRWQQPEARLVVAMALMPQNFFFYEQLPLLLAARSRRELLVLAVTSQLAAMLAGRAMQGAPTFLAWNAAAGPYIMLGLYLPVVVMVLRRPNIATFSVEASDARR